MLYCVCYLGDFVYGVVKLKFFLMVVVVVSGICDMFWSLLVMMRLFVLLRMVCVVKCMVC